MELQRGKRMADAWSIRFNIKTYIEFVRNTILLVGYCDTHSLGGQLMNGPKEVKINGSSW